MSESDNSLQVLFIGEGSENTQTLENLFERANERDVSLQSIARGDVAREYLRGNPVDVAFFHYRGTGTSPPKEDQLNLIRQIRLGHSNLPLITITNDGSEQLAGQIIRTGSDDYLNFDNLTPEVLLDSLEYCMRLRDEQRRLKRTAKIDGLTHLYNREFIMETLRSEIKDAIRHDRQLFVSMLDIDGFKALNDTYGHITGDDVLETIGEIITETLRAGDAAGRYGGDEFLLLLADTDSGGARKALERVLKDIRTTSYELHTDNGDSVTPTISAGLTEFDGRTFESFETLEDLRGIIDQADKALYQAKQQGGNQIERRRYKRVPVQVFPVQISYGSHKHDAELIDYSKEGLRMRFQPMDNYQDEITVHFETNNNHRIERTGYVEWSVMEPDTRQVMVGLDVAVPTEELNPAPQPEEPIDSWFQKTADGSDSP